ncbi:hypothetical protein P692DRAFT_20904400 [Suillus brevipes Sb2]|nr:hypothetical protein P692DRAFT_20904400 [Suillus brevipes Sb2]
MHFYDVSLFILFQTCSQVDCPNTLGISALHEIGIIHRDIKAEHTLIDVRENVRIGPLVFIHVPQAKVSGLSYVDKDEGLLDRQGAHTTLRWERRTTWHWILHNRFNSVLSSTEYPLTGGHQAVSRSLIKRTIY